MTELPLEQLTFETWYEKYPRKVGKGAARTAYTKAMKRAFPDTLHKAVEAFAAIENERTGYQSLKGKAKTEALQYCCNPSTWLNQERWDDEPIQEYLDRPKEPKLIHLKDTDPGYYDWVSYKYPKNQQWFKPGGKFHNKLHVPTPHPLTKGE